MSKTFLTFFVCFFFFFVLLLQANPGPNDAVSIPDAALRGVIEAKLGKSSGDTITESEMASITTDISTFNKGITDLTGLEHATGTPALTFNLENVQDLTPVAGLTQLEGLSLYDNKTTLDLTPIKDLTDLTTLVVQRNSVRADAPDPITDISALEKLTKLTTLYLGDQRVTGLSVLKNKTALVQLRLNGNRDGVMDNPLDVSHLSNLTNLTFLDLDTCDVRNISHLSQLTSLEQLYLSGNSGLEDVSAVQHFVNLETLWLTRTSVTQDSLSKALPSLSKLKDLSLSRTPISDLSALRSLPADLVLEKLNLSYMSHDPEGDLLYAPGIGKGWLLKDISPLVDLMSKGKAVGTNTTDLRLNWNWGLDYESLYTHIPALIAGGISGVRYTPGVPALERASAENHVGGPRTRHTFAVRASNTISQSFGDFKNDRFAKVPVTWRVTAPDDTVSEGSALTGDDGLSSWTITLGNVDDTHTIEAIVPANTRPSEEGPSHDELKVTFTATAISPNNPPVFTSASTVNVLENTTEVITVVAEDPDAEDAITGYAITGGADASLFELSGASSPMDMLRFKTAPDFEMPGSAANSNVYMLILTATSGVGDRELTATQTLTITVFPNNPPVFTSASTVNVLENTTEVITVVAEDPDAEDAITGYTVTGGADASLFELSGASSPMDMLRFKTAPDFEMPGSAANSNVYMLILTATSGVGDRELTATQTLTITVFPNNPPVFTSASTVNVLENTTEVITVVAEDPDAEDAITGYTITGGADASLFELSGASSPMDMLRFKTAPDFEMPGSAANSNVYMLILTATSGVGDRELTATQTLTITVERPVRPPVAPSVGGGGSGPLVLSGPRAFMPFGTQSLIFNEIGNFSDHTNDWIELKNVCNTPLDLSEWQMRLITIYPVELGGQIGTDVISFPNFVLPAGAVVLVTQTDPSRTHLASGFNIATGARQRGAQHPYFVAPDLRLPHTPFLLILQHVVPGNASPTPTLIDAAGSLYFEVFPDGTEVYSDPDTPDLPASTAPLMDVGVYQRQRLDQPGYLAAAWMPSGYRGGIGYDRHVEVSVSLGTPGYRRDPSPSLPAYRLAFNEIRNAANDTHDWVELKNVCSEGVHLKHWQISIVVNTGQLVDEEVDIVSLPDYTVPMGEVLLITNRDPSETVLAGGLNIATGRRQRGAQHLYLVAPALKLPDIPYLLILQQVPEYGERTIEDVAGNYALTTLPDGTEVYPHANVPRAMAPLAPLAHFGAWQRRNLDQPGYLAAAWMSSGYHGGIGYDRYAPASMCLGTPGYRQDPAPVLPVTQRLVFNKIHNDGDNANNFIDYIELKNISETAVRLKHWEISCIASTGEAADEDVGIVQFPDYTLRVNGVLLILKTDPGMAIFDGRNIAPDAQDMEAQDMEAQDMEAQDMEAQRSYFVAPDLHLPETPYLLILRHALGKNGTPEAIEDVAGDYFRTHDNTQVWPLAHTLRPGAPAAPLSEAGTYQRTDARQRGYLATAWTAIASPLHAYAPDAFATLPVTQRLAFNKIRNAANDIGDYIELKNISETAVRLRNWTISSITSDGANPDEDVGMVWFPDYTLPGGGVLLITNTEPDETVIVDGLNITPEASQRRGAQHPYLVAPNLQLPETPYLLILRHALGKNGTPEAIEDMAGDYFRSLYDWPLGYTPHPGAPAAPLSETGTYQRTDARQRGYLATAWTLTASPPGVSDTPTARETQPHALFTPDTQAAGVFNPTLPDEVRISELMSETQGPSGALPEWIELYNASATPVDLESWQLEVENRTGTTHRAATLTLNSLEIPPKQTVLLVNGKGRHSGALPPNRVYDLAAAHPDAFSHRRLRNTLLSRDGFSLKLIHPTGRGVDTCGTLDGDPGTDDLPTWTLPDSKTPQGHRSSLLRRFDGDVLEGTQAAGWLPAMAVAVAVTHYYGHPSDISTPGFLHQILPGTSPTVALSISEIMFTTQTQDRDGLPQWIELYNPSFTGAVNLKDYRLVVETRHAGEPQQIIMNLEAFDVLPKQTVLLITQRGRHSRHFTENRTYNLSQRHPKAFRAPKQWQYLLSSEGFLIQLTDATGNVVDTVGNLDGNPFTADTPAWTWPPGETHEGARASIRRLYEKRGFPLDGRHPEAWVATATVPPLIMTYYGHASDVGNPGYRKGGPLPVVLSRFEAVRDTDTVVVSWTTESSLENAGFHLYRSTQRKDGFIRVNPKLIQGAGTTAERQTYTYVEKPPKTDAVYYYQIQEVSYSGQQQVLATTRIKGYLSADGKHLTTLGALKTDK